MATSQLSTAHKLWHFSIVASLTAEVRDVRHGRVDQNVTSYSPPQDISINLQVLKSVEVELRDALIAALGANTKPDPLDVDGPISSANEAIFHALEYCYINGAATSVEMDTNSH